MNKTLVALAGIAALLVVAYLGYDLLAPQVNQCEGIFQQTAPALEANVKFLKTEGGIVLRNEQIQDLSDQAQEIALNLKSCCVVAGAGNYEQFNQCKASAVLYDKQVAEAVQAVKSVSDASNSDQAQKLKEAEERLAEIIQSANVASAALKQTVANIPSDQPPGPSPDPQGTGTLRLRAAMTNGGDIVESCFEVYDPKEDSQGNMTRLARKCESPSIFELPAGQYAVFAAAEHTTVRADIAVSVGQTTDRIVDLNAGYLGLQTLLAQGSEQADACYEVYETKQDIQGNRKRLARDCSAQPVFLLPAGDYALSASAGYATTSAEIKVPAGGRVDQAMILNAGYLRSYAELTSGGDQVSACFEVYDPKEDLQGNHKRIARECNDKVLMTLPAGDYTLYAQAGNALSSIDVTIAAGKPTKQPVVLNAGYLRVQAQMAGAEQFVSACFDVYAPKQDVQGNRERLARSCDQKAIFTLPAGSYFLAAQAGDASAEQTVDVKPGGEPNDYVMALSKP